MRCLPHGMLSTNYKYYRLSQDLQGRGPLGFARVDSIDTQTGIVTSTWPWQEFPHIGTIHYAQVKTANGILLSDNTETRAVAVLSMGSSANTKYSYVTQSVVARRDLNGADLGTTKVNNSVPDAFGNILSTTTQSTSLGNSAGWSVTKGMKYDNDASNWRIGELRELSESRSNNTGTGTRVTAYTYDGKGLQKTETRQGDVTSQLTTTYNRDGFGNVAQAVLTWRDPATNTDKSRTISDITSTANGRFPYTVKNALGQTETRTFDARNSKHASLTTANGLTMRWDSDGFGRELRAIAIDGTESISLLKTCQANCPVGATTVSIQETKRGTIPVAVPVLIFADSAGRALRSLTWGFDGRKIVSDSIYDSRGRISDVYWARFASDTEALADALSVSNGAILSKHIEYDDLDRITLVTTLDEQGKSQRTTTTYDGFATIQTNAKNYAITEVHDLWGKLDMSIDAGAKVTRYEFDPFGSLSKTIDSLGNVVKVKYDTWGRRIELNDPDMGLTTFNVDPLGLVWRRVSAKQALAGKATIIQYDEVGRMISRVAQDATTSHVAGWTYDKLAGQVDCASSKSCGELVESYTLLADGSTMNRTGNLGGSNI